MTGSAVSCQSGSLSPCLRDPPSWADVTVQPVPGQGLNGERCRSLRLPHSAPVRSAFSLTEARGKAGFQGTVPLTRDHDEH